MANPRLFSLISPLSAERRRVRGEPLETQVAVPATAAPTPEPDDDTPYIDTGAIRTVRLLVTYDGAVSAAKLRLWLLQDGIWYRASGIELDPATGNRAYDAKDIGQYTRFAVQVEEMSGGGTVEVRALGVR